MIVVVSTECNRVFLMTLFSKMRFRTIKECTYDKLFEYSSFPKQLKVICQMFCLKFQQCCVDSLLLVWHLQNVKNGIA